MYKICEWPSGISADNEGHLYFYEHFYGYKDNIYKP